MNEIEFLKRHGFECRQDATDLPILNYYVKEIGFCNSNCIGCEYDVCIKICFFDRQYNLSMYFYKPRKNDDNSLHKPKTFVECMPSGSLCIGYFERHLFGDVIYDCINVIKDVVQSMNFNQISGMDFIDLSDSYHMDVNREYRRLLDELGEREEKVLQ